MLIDIFDNQIEKIKNMKRLIYGVALIGIASVGLAFMTIKPKKKKLKEYCVTISCKGMSSFKETIQANYDFDAKKIAEQRYPNCKVTSYSSGACK